MSLIGSGLSAPHRATIERNAAAGVGSDGWADTPDWEPHITELPCWLQSTIGHEAVIDKSTVTAIEDLRLFTALGADVTERDRLGDVTDRCTQILAGPVSIRAVLRHKDHLEIVLVRIT